MQKKLFVIAYVLFAHGLIPAELRAETIIEVSPATRTALGISVLSVRLIDSFEGARGSGVVIAPPGQLNQVISPFNGIMLEPLVMPGMQVSEGQDVALLHSLDYSSADAELETRRLTAEHKKHLAVRAEELRKLGLRSTQEADEAVHEAMAAQLAYDAISQRLALVHRAEGAGRFKLISPVSGVVVHVLMESGERVQTSMPVISIFEGSDYWARVQIPERLHSLVSVGAPAAVSNSATMGKIVSIDPEVDLTTRSVELLVSLPNDYQWRLGQLTDVTFQTAFDESALSIPAKAVFRMGGQEMVFVDTQKGFHAVPITTIVRSRDVFVVAAQLEEGDKVAVSGLAALKNLLEESE